MCRPGRVTLNFPPSIPMSYQALYTAVATSTGGRDGTTATNDGVVQHALSTPKAMGGPGKEGATNPEQLFACGYSACFAGALGYVAMLEKKKLEGIQVTAHVSFGKEDSGSFALAVKLEVHVPGLDHAEAERLVHTAHQVCPYSRATRNNIEVTLAVV